MRQLALIVSVFLFFFGVLFYFAMRTFWFPEDGTSPRQPVSTEAPFNEADSLLQVAYDAVNERDFMTFQAAFDSLHIKYPFSRQAAEVARLAEAFDPEVTEMTVSADVANNNKAPGPSLKTPRVKSTRKAPTQSAPVTKPPASEPVGDPVVLDASLVEVAEPMPYSQFEYDRILSRMRKVRNDRTGITYYYHKHLSHFVYKNSVEAYIAQNDLGETWLRLRIYFFDESPLSIKQYVFYADDREYTILGRFGTVEKGSGEPGHWEWFDMRTGDREIGILQQVMNADRAAIKYHGADRKIDRAMTEREKLRLLQVYNAYLALKGGPPNMRPSASVSSQ